MSGLVEHLESTLGPIRGGFANDADGVRLPFQIAQFDGGPIADMVTLVSLGFSEHRLRHAHSRIRQELLLAARPRFMPGNLPGIVQQVALKAIESDAAIGVAEVLERRGEIVAGTSMTALYALPPVYFSDDFHVHQSSSGEQVFIVWLVPITAAEASFVREQGHEAFEDMLEKLDPDLLDLSRASIV